MQSFMDKAALRKNLAQYNVDINATRTSGLDFVLGEANSYTCHGAPGVSNAAGAAIWTLDYALQAATIGISQVFFHRGVGFKYNLIQPVALNRSITDATALSKPLPPHIQPNYYGAIIAAEAIGNASNTRVVELSIADKRISGYAFYVANKLKRAVLINSLAYQTTDTTPRNSTTISLGITGTGAPSKMTVKWLSIPYADSTSGLTYGGQTYETSDGKVSGSLKVTTANVSDGVKLQETEVALLTFL